MYAFSDVFGMPYLRDSAWELVWARCRQKEACFYMEVPIAADICDPLDVCCFKTDELSFSSVDDVYSQKTHKGHFQIYMHRLKAWVEPTRLYLWQSVALIVSLFFTLSVLRF